MKRVLIFGNSASGKSTLAKKLCSTEGLSHLDLDTLAWLPTVPPERKPLPESAAEIEAFIDANQAWVIEGCYADLLDVARPYSSEAIFMNLPVDVCIENARRRPWEPHKYSSRAAQDRNLSMLLNWIAEYPERTDTCSYPAHEALYERCYGKRRMITRNDELT